MVIAQGKADFSALAGSKADPAEVLQELQGGHHRAVHIVDIQLYHLVCFHRSCVGDGAGDLLVDTKGDLGVGDGDGIAYLCEGEQKAMLLFLALCIVGVVAARVVFPHHKEESKEEPSNPEETSKDEEA